MASNVEYIITGFYEIPSNILEAIVASRVLEQLGLKEEHFRITLERSSSDFDSSSDAEMYKAMGFGSDSDSEEIIDYSLKDYEMEEDGPGWYEDVPFYGWHLNYEALQIAEDRLLSCDEKTLCVSLFSMKRLTNRTVARCQIITSCEGGEYCPWADVTMSQSDLEAMEIKLLPGDVSLDGPSLIGAVGRGPSSAGHF